MMTEIHIRRAPGTWVVRAGGAVLGESHAALEVTIGAESAIYFPRGDLAMAFLDLSPTRRQRNGCEAEYFGIATQSGALPDAAWSFPAPRAEASRLAGHLSFDTSRVAVERV